MLSHSKNKGAIYIQQSAFARQERQLLERATFREILVDRLEGIIDAQNRNQRPYDIASLYDIFHLLNCIRKATVEVIKEIDVWQKEFTSYKKLNIMGCNDYLEEMLIKDITPMSGSVLKKVLNFSISTGNILLLPLKNKADEVPLVDVDSKTANEIRLFATPDLQCQIDMYQILLNMLPDQLYRRLTPLQLWINKPWDPPIFVNQSVEPSCIMDFIVQSQAKSCELSKASQKEKKPPMVIPRVYNQIEIKKLSDVRKRKSLDLARTKEKSSISKSNERAIDNESFTPAIIAEGSVIKVSDNAAAVSSVEDQNIPRLSAPTYRNMSTNQLREWYSTTVKS